MGEARSQLLTCNLCPHDQCPPKSLECVGGNDSDVVSERKGYGKKDIISTSA